MPERRLTLPNLITIVRIAVTPAVWFLAMSQSTPLRLLGFVVFLAAALSDVWDGYLARKHGWITEMGKLLDPLADKLLLVVTLVPVYLISHRPGEMNEVPWWGPLPEWVLAVIFGRELLITLLRQYAARRGTVIPAGTLGKRKALMQNLFVGGLLLWYPVLETARAEQWLDAPLWKAWSFIHTSWVGITLVLALVLTVVSFLDYIRRYRGVLGQSS